MFFLSLKSALSYMLFLVCSYWISSNALYQFFFIKCSHWPSADSQAVYDRLVLMSLAVACPGTGLVIITLFLLVFLNSLVIIGSVRAVRVEM